MMSQISSENQQDPLVKINVKISDEKKSECANILGQFEDAIKQRVIEIENRIQKLSEKIKNAFIDYC